MTDLQLQFIASLCAQAEAFKFVPSELKSLIQDNFKGAIACGIPVNRTILEMVELVDPNQNN